MEAYKDLIRNVLENGQRYETNKGTCLGVIGAQVVYDISKGIPIVTGKKTNVLWAVAEYTMFLKGIGHTDFLKKYGAEKIWETQGLSEDWVVEKPRNPMVVVEEYAVAKGISEEEAHQFFATRAEKYSKDRNELDTNPPLLENSEDASRPQIDMVAYQAKLKEFEDFLTQPFVEAGIVVLEKSVAKTKGDLGPIYGTQWRRWEGVTGQSQKRNLDQLAMVVGRLNENPESRQIIMTSWNPLQITEEKYSYDDKIKAGYMGQPPCHVNYHFLTRLNEQGERVLHLIVWVRSNDLMLGHPFNALGAGLIAHLVAKTCGFKTGTLTMQISDCHIYENQLPNVQKYLDAQIFEQPSFQLPEHVDVFNFEVEDIISAIGEYQHGPYIPFTLNTNDNVLKENQQAEQETND